MADLPAAVREAQGVRKVRPDELPQIAAVLRAAFFDDPAVAWLMNDESRRASRLERAFGLFLERIWYRQDECYTTANAVGAAVWELPDQWKQSALEQLRLMPGLLSIYHGTTPRLLRALAAMEAGHPEAPHYYLPFAGVSPDWQGRGIGAALLAPVLSRCDTDRVPAYLEATTPRNRALYERHGFSVTAEFRLGKGSPPLWRMWRPAGG